MSPYIVRLEPVRERKRQPKQVPGNGALDGDHSIPMTLSGRHLRTKLRTIFPGCQPTIAACSNVDCKPSVQITRSSVSTVSISERGKALAERNVACGDVLANQRTKAFDLRPVDAGRRRLTLVRSSALRPSHASATLPQDTTMLLSD